MKHRPFLNFVLWVLVIALGAIYLIAISIEQSKQGGYWEPKKVKVEDIESLGFESLGFLES